MSVSSISTNNMNPDSMLLQDVQGVRGANSGAGQASQTSQQPVKQSTVDKVTISPQAMQLLSPQKVASDGDSAAVETAESAATERVEKMNNGFTPKAATTFSRII